MNTPLLQIEQATKIYADAREILTERVSNLKTDVEQLQREHLRGIRSAVRTVGNAHGRLSGLIETHPDLFNKPRTKIISGVRVGINKGKGVIVVNDQDKTCQLIAKKLPEQFDALVKQSQTPIKAALTNLSATELRQIGVTVEQTGDQVVIKTTDSTVDKYVTALLKEAEKIESEAEVA